MRIAIAITSRRVLVGVTAVVRRDGSERRFVRVRGRKGPLIPAVLTVVEGLWGERRGEEGIEYLSVCVKQHGASVDLLSRNVDSFGFRIRRARSRTNGVKGGVVKGLIAQISSTRAGEHCSQTVETHQHSRED